MDAVSARVWAVATAIRVGAATACGTITRLIRTSASGLSARSVCSTAAAALVASARTATGTTSLTGCTATCSRTAAGRSTSTAASTMEAASARVRTTAASICDGAATACETTARLVRAAAATCSGLTSASAWVTRRSGAASTSTVSVRSSAVGRTAWATTGCGITVTTAGWMCICVGRRADWGSFASSRSTMGTGGRRASARCISVSVGSATGSSVIW